MKVENILEDKSLYKQLVEVSNAGSIVDAGEPESGYVKPGVARRLGRIRGSQDSDEWFTRGGWTQLQFPKGDNPFGDDSQIRERQDIIFNPPRPKEPIESDDFITSGVGVKGQDFVQKSVDLHGKSVKTLKENLILERMDFLHVAQGIITLHKLNSKVRFLKKSGKTKADYVIETDICKRCNKGELIPVDNEGVVICNNCSVSLKYIVEHDKPSYSSSLS